jgi:hypothetical protein
MTLPRKLVSESTREKRFRCPSHLKWVRQHACCVPGCDRRPIEAAHVRTGTGGGVGMKPGDDWVISLCSDHHREQHQIGERAFEARRGIDMKALAVEFFAKSPHRMKKPRAA